MQDYQILLDAVRQNFADVASRYRVHEKQADICAERYKRIETIKGGRKFSQGMCYLPLTVFQ